MRSKWTLALAVAAALLSGGCVGPFGCVCRDPDLNPPRADAPGRESAKLKNPASPVYTRPIDGRTAVSMEETQS
jgi:hypothetical protein